VKRLGLLYYYVNDKSIELMLLEFIIESLH